MWRRDCKYASVVTYGCKQHDFGIDGKVIQVAECVCDGDECNREMGPMESTSTAQTTTNKGTSNFLQSFFNLINIFMRVLIVNP